MAEELKRVIILGAGASCEMGYPLGSKLLENLREFYDNNRWIRNNGNNPFSVRRRDGVEVNFKPKAKQCGINNSSSSSSSRNNISALSTANTTKLL